MDGLRGVRCRRARRPSCPRDSATAPRPPPPVVRGPFSAFLGRVVAVWRRSAPRGRGGAPSARRGERAPGGWHADQQVLTRGAVCDACWRRPVVPEERSPRIRRSSHWKTCVLRTSDYSGLGLKPAIAGIRVPIGRGARATANGVTAGPRRPDPRSYGSPASAPQSATPPPPPPSTPHGPRTTRGSRGGPSW